jgi:hypothetical protein
MPLYQVSFFDRRGRLSHLREIDCSDDDAAIELMAGHRHEHSLELWRGRELVWKFDARKGFGMGLLRLVRDLIGGL